jgi:hypothetical protein
MGTKLVCKKRLGNLLIIEVNLLVLLTLFTKRFNIYRIFKLVDGNKEVQQYGQN